MQNENNPVKVNPIGGNSSASPSNSVISRPSINSSSASTFQPTNNSSSQVVSPAFDWNHYEVPKAQVVLPTQPKEQVLDNAITEEIVRSNPDAQVHIPFKRIWISVGAGLIVLLLIAAGSSFWNSRHNKSALNDSKLGSITDNNPSNTLQSSLNSADLKINRNTTISNGRKLSATGAVAVQNEADSTAAFTIQNAKGTNVMVVDTVNNRVGIGGIPTGTAALQISGDLSINGNIISADGKVSLGNDGLRIGSVLVCTARGCISSSSPSPTPTSPTIDVANVAYLNKNQTFNGSINTTSGFAVNGATGANITCPAGEYLKDPVVTGGLITGGVCNPGPGVAVATLQQVYNASTPATFALNNVNGLMQIQDAASPLGTDLFEVTNNGGGNKYFAVNATGISVLGNSNVSGQYQVNGSQISSANLSNDTNLAKVNGDTIFTGNNSFSSASNSFTGSGSGLTSLNASNVSSGTLSDTRLSSNVALLNAHNNFQNTANSLTAFQIQDAAGTSNLFVADTINSRIGIGIAPATYMLSVGGSINGSTVFQNGNQVCDTGGNCSYSSSSLTDSANIARLDANQTFTGVNTFSNSSNSFTGSGSGLSNVDAAKLGGQAGSYYTNATNLSSGTVNDSRLSANVALLGSNQTASGNKTFSGTVLLQNVANSTSDFQIQNALGTSNLFIADTTNTRIAIGQASANYPLDVAGDINSTTGIRVGGTLLCSSGGCLAASGSGNYIQNGTTVQTANQYTRSNAAGSVTGVFEGANGQSADILDVQAYNGGTKYLAVNTSGIAVTGDVNVTGTYKVNGNPFDLQAAYNNASSPATITLANNKDLLFDVQDTVLDPSATINLHCTSCGSGGGAFEVQSGGTMAFRIQGDSQAYFGSVDNNAAAVQFRDQVGSPYLIGDALHRRIGIGSGPTTNYPLDVSGDINSTGLYRINGSQISSSSLSNDSNLAKLDGTGPQTFTGNNKFTGTVLAQNTADSTSSFQVQNAAGTSVLFNIDTTNNRVGIGTAAPGSKLDIQANTNIGLNVNQTGVSNLLQLQSNGSGVVAVTSTGATTFKNSTDSTSAFKIQDSNFATLFNADTSNDRIGIGTATPTSTLQVVGSGLITETVRGYSMWPSSTTPPLSSDPLPYELGVKFRADKAGYITGLKFYKSVSNTGVHVGNLWTSTGTNLATVTFAGETASGWQQASFASPVLISANTTYIISYYAPVGHYGYSPNYFTSSGRDFGNLHALANGVDGVNGVFKQASGGGFPNASFNNSNYWVDAIFDDSPTQLTLRESGSTNQDWLMHIANNGQFELIDGTGTSTTPFKVEANAPDNLLNLKSDGTLQIQNASGNSLLTADTVNQAVNLFGNTKIGNIAGWGDIQFSDGFESGNTSKWTNNPSDGVTSIQSTTAHSNKYAAYFSHGGSQLATSVSGNNLYARAWVYVSSQTTASVDLFYLDNGGNGSSWHVQRTTAGQLCINGSNCSGSLPLNSWHEVELQVITGAGTGSTNLWLDGSSLAALSSQSNGVSTIQSFGAGDSNASDVMTMYMDDAVVSTVRNTGSSTLSVGDALNVQGSTSLNGQLTIHPAVEMNNIVSIQNWAGNNLLNIGTYNGNGSTTLGNQHVVVRTISDTTTAFQVQNAAGGSLINVDSSNSNITLNGLQTGALGTWQIAGNATPQARSAHSSIVANGYIYVLGGSNSSAVYYSKLNANGSTNTWTTSSNPLPIAISYQSSVVYNNYVYIIGGITAGGAQSTVYYAKLNADGSTSAWSTASNALPAVRYRHTSVVANGYVYVFGGENGSTPQSTVYYAKLNADGSVGTWTTSANALPQTNEDVSSSVANGYVYVVGGYNGGTLSTVYYAKLNTDGSTSTWTTASNSLPVAMEDARTVVSNGYIYALAGDPTAGGSSTTSVYYSALNSSNGSVGVWQTNSTVLPTFLGTPASAVIANGYIYLTGGNNLNAPVTYYASTSRVQIGANLDLVGLQGGTLADAGGIGNGSTGGSIIAGNITAVGSLQVQGGANFVQGASVVGAFNVSSTTGALLLAADPTNMTITLGAPSATPVLLVLGNKNTSGDPSCTSGALYYNSNSNQFRACQNGAWGSLALTPSYTSSLPGSPYDGQEVYYQADATNGIIWHLRYNAGSASTYKWEYLGGSPLVSNGGSVALTTSQQDLGATAITIPRNGQYLIKGKINSLTSPPTQGFYAYFSYYDAHNSFNTGVGNYSTQTYIGTWIPASQADQRDFNIASTSVTLTSGDVGRLAAYGGTGVTAMSVYGSQLEIVPIRIN